MNLTGDFVRRAAANVSSTVSSTMGMKSNKSDNDNQRSSRYHDLTSNAKDKYTMTIKCTPNKDAMTTASLSIKSGFMRKKNEQGVWEKRFVCTVPHLFLYYYQSDSSEAPRGIIDLELYSNIIRENTNILKMSPMIETSDLRSFYFQEEDQDTLTDWISSLIRDRYFNINDERNAYMQMQYEMTGVLDNARTYHKSTVEEKDVLEQQLNQAIQSSQEAMNVLQAVLVIMGITEEDMANLYDINRIGYYLEKGVIDMKTVYETKLTYLQQQLVTLESERIIILENEKNNLQKVLEEKERKIVSLEQLINELINNHNEHKNEMKQQMEGVLSQFQLSINTQIEFNQNNTLLKEHKKVLVNEVKELRNKVNETNTNVIELIDINTQLTTTIQSLQAEIIQLKSCKDIETSKMNQTIYIEDDANAILQTNENILTNMKESQNNNHSKYTKIQKDKQVFNILDHIIHDSNLITNINTSTNNDSNTSESEQTSEEYVGSLDGLSIEHQQPQNSLEQNNKTQANTNNKIDNHENQTSIHDEVKDIIHTEAAITIDDINKASNSEVDIATLLSTTNSSNTTSIASATNNTSSSSKISSTSNSASSATMSLFSGAYSMLSGSSSSSSTSASSNNNNTTTAISKGGNNNNSNNTSNIVEESDHSYTSTSDQSISCTTNEEDSSSINITSMNASAMLFSVVPKTFTSLFSSSSTSEKASSAIPSSNSNNDLAINSPDNNNNNPNNNQEFEYINSTTSTTSSTTSTPTKLPNDLTQSTDVAAVVQVGEKVDEGTVDNKDLSYYLDPTNTSSFSEHHRLSNTMRLLCYRCKGSVEGPKYSTCTCKIPALTEDELEQSNHNGNINNNNTYGSNNSSSSTATMSKSWGFASGVLSRGMGSIVQTISTTIIQSPSSTNTTTTNNNNNNDFNNNNNNNNNNDTLTSTKQQSVIVNEQDHISLKESQSETQSNEINLNDYSSKESSTIDKEIDDTNSSMEISDKISQFSL